MSRDMQITVQLDLWGNQREQIHWLQTGDIGQEASANAARKWVADTVSQALHNDTYFKRCKAEAERKCKSCGHVPEK